jgi:hypothetical protein
MKSSVEQVVTDLTTPLLASIVQEFEGLVKQLWVHAQRNADAGFAELEERARQLSKECFATALQAAAQLHRQQIEDEWLLGKVCCECGHLPQYKGKQSRTIQTWVGAVSIERGYFYCRGCGTGRYPLDEALGIARREHFSDGVQEGVCLLGVQMPFDGVSQAMELLSGISVSPREAERMTEQRGQMLDEHLHSEGELLSNGYGSANGNELGSAPSLEGVWAVSLDAGKVRYQDGWHDTKAGVVFWAEQAYDEHEQSEVVGATVTAIRQSYIAEVGSMEQAGVRLSAEAWRRGIGPNERVICLGDGAPSNWTQFEMHFPNRVEVLDWYHATEHLWQAGNGVFGQGTPEAVGWVKRWEKELWEGRVEAVIVALNRESQREGAEGEAARAQIHYFEANKHRMRYSKYRAAGYPIGSGTVESACKRLIGARMKGAGMCWGKSGAQGVLTLRAELLSDRWEQSWSNTCLKKVA